MKKMTILIRRRIANISNEKNPGRVGGDGDRDLVVAASKTSEVPTMADIRSGGCPSG